MSKDQEYDRDAALANLTEEELAALNDDELSPEETAALKDIAGEAGNDDEDIDADDDEDGDGVANEDVDPAPAASVGDTPAAEAKAEPPAKTDAVASTDDGDGDDEAAGFSPRYEAALPDDFRDQVQALETREADAQRRFEDGELDSKAFAAEMKAITADRVKLDRLAFKADLAEDMNAQAAQQQWQFEINRFMSAEKARTGGIDYAADAAKRNDLDTFVKALAANPENAARSMGWFLREAHRRTLVLHGLAEGKPGPEEAKDKGSPAAPEKKPADKPKAERKPDVAQLPKTLAQVPGGDGPGDVGDEFAELDKLDGLAYETALAKLTPAQRERYLESV